MKHFNQTVTRRLPHQVLHPFHHDGVKGVSYGVVDESYFG